MEFNIKKNATLPLLKMQVVRDGRSEYQSFMDSLGSASIFFSMIDELVQAVKMYVPNVGIVYINNQKFVFYDSFLKEPS